MNFWKNCLVLVQEHYVPFISIMWKRYKAGIKSI